MIELDLSTALISRLGLSCAREILGLPFVLVADSSGHAVGLTAIEVDAPQQAVAFLEI